MTGIDQPMTPGRPLSVALTMPSSSSAAGSAGQPRPASSKSVSPGLPSSHLGTPASLALPSAKGESSQRGIRSHSRARSGSYFYTSPIWAGYDVTGGGFGSVSGSWVQPSISADSTTESQTFFYAGLDGDGSDTTEWIGTDAENDYGVVTYWAWFTMYPYPTLVTPIDSLDIAPGDTINASVTTDGWGDFTLTIADATTGQSFTTDQYDADAECYSAMVGVEPPVSSTTGDQYLLSDFGTASFFDCDFNGAPISAFDSNQIDMAAWDGTIVASTSPLGSDGGSFSVTAYPSGMPAPTLTSFTPASGPVGSSVTLHGTGFTDATEVSFDGQSTSFQWVSDTQIEATVPPYASSGPITITSPSGTATCSSNFVVTAFKLKRDGWRFANGNDLKTSDDLAVWKKMFGSGKTSLSVYARMLKADKAKGEPGIFAGGVCYGMAASAGSYFMNLRSLSAAGIRGVTYPWDWGKWGLAIPHLTYSYFNGTRSKGTAPRLRTEIELFYLTQFAANVDKATEPNELSRSKPKLGRGWSGSYKQALAQWVGDLAATIQTTGPQILSLGDTKDGYHAVVAYAVTSDAPGTYAIHIYDSNFPGNASRSIPVNTATGVWSYSSRFWEGGLRTFEFWQPRFSSKRSGDIISFVAPSLPTRDVAQTTNGPLRLAACLK